MTKVFHPTGGKGYVTRLFFYDDCSIYPHVPGVGCPHMGHDESRSRGAPLYAMLDGIVIEARNANNGGYGKRITLKHRPHDLQGQDNKSLYAHLDEYLVEVGDEVKAGDEIGRMGDTGVGGVHVHIEFILPEKPLDRLYVKKGTEYSDGWAVDPYPYVLQFYGDEPIFNGLVVVPQGVNVRTGPGLSYDKVGAIPVTVSGPIVEEQEADGYNWVRWSGFDDQPARWSAASYRNGDVYIELEPIVTPEPPEPPGPCYELALQAFEDGRKQGQKEAIEAALNAWRELGYLN